MSNGKPFDYRDGCKLKSRHDGGTLSGCYVAGMDRNWKAIRRLSADLWREKMCIDDDDELKLRSVDFDECVESAVL